MSGNPGNHEDGLPQPR